MNFIAARSQIIDGQILDIEELVKLGVKSNACPFYMSKEIQSRADIVFLPYNYLLDANARQAQGIDVKNSIIIFDEAHNLESICTESTSFELTTNEIVACAHEIQSFIDLLSRTPSFPFTLKDVSDLKSCFQKLASEIFKMKFNGLSSHELTFPGEFIYELLERADIQFENVYDKIKILEGIQDALTQG